jgi:hypothetical protein
MRNCKTLPIFRVVLLHIHIGSRIRIPNDPDPAESFESDRIRIRKLLKVIVRPFEFGGVTIGSFDPFHNLKARQVCFKSLSRTKCF